MLAYRDLPINNPGPPPMKTVLITGCSSGYGLATARHFHAQGWRVIATMRTPRADLLPIEIDRAAPDGDDVETAFSTLLLLRRIHVFETPATLLTLQRTNGMHVSL